MEEYQHDSSSTSHHRVSFLYSPISSSDKNDNTSETNNNNNSNSKYGRGYNNSINNNNNHHQHMLFPHMSSLLPQTTRNCFLSDQDPSKNNNPCVKSEASSSRINHYSMLMRAIHNTQETNNNKDNVISDVEAMKTKIISHPHYSTLLQAYLDCQKIGAPPEVVDRITTIRQDFEARQQSSAPSVPESSRDPELDQFMVN